MRKPKFKFELSIGETISLLSGTKVDRSGALAPDPRYTCTDLISRPGFKLPKEFYGKEVNIALYENVGTFTVLISLTTHSSFMESQNSFDFAQGQSMRVFVKHEGLKLDADNFTIYTYNTHPRFSKLFKEVSRENGEMYMRAKLKGNLSYGNGAFDKIASLNINNCMTLNILKYNYGTDIYEPYYYTVRFTKLDCQFDYDKRSVTPKTEPDDQYSLILSGMNTKYDLIKIQTRRSKLNYKVPPMKQVYVYGSSQVTNIIGESYFMEDGVVFPEIPVGYDYCMVLNQNCFARTAFFREIHALLQDPDYPTGERISVAFHNESSFSYGLVEPFPLGLTPDSYAFGPKDFRWKLHFNTASHRLELQEYDTGVVYARSGVLPAQSMLDISANVEFYKVSDGAWCGVTNNAFNYDVYQRTLFYKHPDNQTPGEYHLPDEDFAYSGGVYNRAEVAYANRITCRCASDIAVTPGELGLLQGVNGYYTNAGLLHADNDARIIPVCTDTWSGISIWAMGSIYYANLVNRFGYDFQNLCAFSVVDAIQAVVKKVAPKVVIYENMQCSEFLYGFYNPIGLQRVYPIITPLSNIQAGVYTQAAQKAEVSLRELLDLLKNAMQLYWYIDDDNVMHIEHKKWFLNAGTYEQKLPVLDITVTDDIWNNKSLDVGHGELRYDSSEMFKTFKLSAEDDATDCSKPAEITVEDSSVAVLSDRDVNLGEFKVNLDYMFATGSADVREEGFAFVLAELSRDETANALFGPHLYTIPRVRFTDETFKCDCGRQYSIQPLNTYAMPHYLIKYYMWDFPGSVLSPNLGIVLAKTNMRKQQIRIPIEREIGVYNWIQTRFGRGLINSISIDFDTQYADIELLHDSSEYPWPYEEQVEQREVLYDKRIDDFGNTYDEDDNFSIHFSPATVLQYQIPDRAPYNTVHSLADIFQNYPLGVDIFTQFKFSDQMLPATEDTMYILSSDRYPLYVPLTVTRRWLAITAKYNIHTDKYTIGAGFVDISPSESIQPVSDAFANIDIPRGEYVAVQIGVRQVGSNVLSDIRVVSLQSSQALSCSVPRTSISTPGASICVASANYSSLLAYKDIKIIKR